MTPAEIAKGARSLLEKDRRRLHSLTRTEHGRFELYDKQLAAVQTREELVRVADTISFEASGVDHATAGYLEALGQTVRYIETRLGES